MSDVRPVASDTNLEPIIDAYGSDAGDDLLAAVRRGLLGGYVLEEDDGEPVAALLTDDDAETGTVTIRFYHALEPNADERMTRLLDEGIQRLQRTASRIISRFEPARQDWDLTKRGFDQLERLYMTLDLADFRERAPLLPDGYILRPLKPAHVPELILPRISANAGTLEHQLFSMSRERAERLLSRYAAGTITPTVDRDATLTALHTGTPIGAILVQRPTRADGRLVDIFVAPEHQGQGIGRALLVSALRALKASDAGRAEVETRRQLPAYHLLRRLGFVETGRQIVRFWLSVMGPA